MKEHEYQCPYKSDPVQPNSGKYTFLTTSGYNQTTGSRIHTGGTNTNLKLPSFEKIKCIPKFFVSLPVIMTKPEVAQIQLKPASSPTLIQSNPNLRELVYFKCILKFFITSG